MRASANHWLISFEKQIVWDNGVTPLPCLEANFDSGRKNHAREKEDCENRLLEPVFFPQHISDSSKLSENISVFFVGSTFGARLCHPSPSQGLQLVLVDGQLLDKADVSSKLAKQFGFQSSPSHAEFCFVIPDNEQLSEAGVAAANFVRHNVPPLSTQHYLTSSSDSKAANDVTIPFFFVATKCGKIFVHPFAP